MAKKKEPVGDFARIRNLVDGPRDYPKTTGASVFLPPKAKGVSWPVIPKTEISEAMRAAERKGVIAIETMEGGATDGPGTAESDVD